MTLIATLSKQGGRIHPQMGAIGATSVQSLMVRGTSATVVFNPAWAMNATVVVNGAPEQSVQR